MEENEIDPFSTLTIQSEQLSYMNDSIPSEKLKPRRNTKTTVKPNGRLNASLCVFKLKVKYDGFFKPIKKGNRQKYCFGKVKTLSLDSAGMTFDEFLEELSTTRPLREDEALSLCFLDKTINLQSFIKLEDDNGFQMMLTMYENEKEVMIYMTVMDKEIQRSANMNFIEENILQIEETGEDNFAYYEEGSDYCHSEESYHSLHSEDEEIDIQHCDDDGDTSAELVEEFYSYNKEQPVIEIGARFPHAIAFRRALSHFAITKDFSYALEKSDPTRVTACCAQRDCSWRIHASITEDGITFEVKTFQTKHSCSGVNKSGNKHATKGWIADRIVDDIRNEGDISTKKLQQKLQRKFALHLPYHRVWQGKELAMQEIYGKWDDSFLQVGAFKEEILTRNPGSIVDFKTEPTTKTKKKKSNEEGSNNQHFQRFFIALSACTNGFLTGCRPYIGLDACHLKGKWKGCLATATAVDGNSWMFPVAFAVLENESEESWEWFLRKLQHAIGMPEGLVISSDMQKGLIKAVSQVYPLAEHRECMRHLYSNFKRHFSGDLFKLGLWAAARTYSPTKYEKIIAEMEKICPEAIQYLHVEHSKLWSRSQFGATAKCDYITNNISETFNSWVCEERHKPVLNLLDSIRKKIMVRMHERRRISRTWKKPLVPRVDEYINNISRNLKGYDVLRCTDTTAEVEHNGKRWAINLAEKTCTCREWQIKGIPCIHGAAFIASIRNVRWEEYVDPYFTVTKFKEAYAGEIAAMPSNHEWKNCDLGYKMLPPLIKRPPGRPRKSRIKPLDEPKKKKSNKCSRCGLSGHHRNTCKNDVPVYHNEDTHNVQAGERVKKKSRAKKWTCTTSFFQILMDDNI